MRPIVVLFLVVACRGPEPLERLPSPPPAARLDPSKVPPPPPPPPPVDGTMPPPAEIRAYLTAQAASTEPWTATLIELRETKGTFLGHRNVRRRALAPTRAAELARRLGEDASYTTGDNMGYSDAWGIELARGTATLRFIVNEGHLSLDPSDERHLCFSLEMIRFLRELHGE